ncbi:hypothetical protein [Chitinophaga sp. 212800010-3]|uniref:hypothetical protein n=1 Tax=unclassified Chitinophaga TaxID=2619133 RepID=UPI002DE8FBAC|nr:Cytochrome c domain-containing protein [Chitinophaga sp. 212800010-3]
MKKYPAICIFFAAALTLSAFIRPDEAGGLFPRLSDYHIYDGNPAALSPARGFHAYQVANGLFADYAEKQRLLKLPQGTTFTAIGDGIPDLPEGTLLVKTFYYFNDKRDVAKGKKIIETRVLLKDHSGWTAGTYIWNNEQTEALLSDRSANIPVEWTDANGQIRNITYHVPGAKDCGSCHRSGQDMQPIGFRIRNLNTNGQLQQLQQQGLMTPANLSGFTTISHWKNPVASLEERARAYLDITCGHCHSAGGSCEKAGLKLNYETSLPYTGIVNKGDRIVHMIAKGRMPRIGTAVVDEEGLALVREYVNSLKNR